MGYRPGGGVLGVARPRSLLAIVAGWSLAWIFTWFGTIARSAPQRAGHLDDDPVPADVPVQRVRAGRHAAGLAAGVREGQPGLARRHRRSATWPTTARSPPRSAGRCSRLRGRRRDLRAAVGAQLQAARSEPVSRPSLLDERSAPRRAGSGPRRSPYSARRAPRSAGCALLGVRRDPLPGHRRACCGCRRTGRRARAAGRVAGRHRVAQQPPGAEREQRRAQRPGSRRRRRSSSTRGPVAGRAPNRSRRFGVVGAGRVGVRGQAVPPPNTTHGSSRWRRGPGAAGRGSPWRARR